MERTHSRGNMDGVVVLAVFIHHPVELTSQISSRVVLEVGVQLDGRIVIHCEVSVPVIAHYIFALKTT